MSLAVEAIGRHSTGRAWRPWTLPVLAIGLLASALLCACIGAVTLTPERCIDIIARAIAGQDFAATDRDAVILLAVRLPRIACAALVGAVLAVSGGAMQGLFRNPLVDPGLLGVSTGSALGVVAAIVLGAQLGGLPAALGTWLLPIAGFAAGLASVTVVQAVARSEGRSHIAPLLLAGIALNALAGAMTGLFTFLADDAQIRTIAFWMLGGLGGATWPVVAALALFLAPALLLLPRYARALNAMSLGESEASHLGVDVERTRRRVILLVALGVGASVALTGAIGFVGLVVPHLLRMALGADHRLLLPSAALLGAILMLFADALARSLVAPAELPIGIVTAAIGTPFFLALLVRERGRLA